MIDIKISPKIKDACPDMTLGIIQATVSVKSSSDYLINEIDNYCNYIQEELKIEDLTSDLIIKDGKSAYKTLGKSPSKYRLSSKALLRRIIQGKGIYRVNNVVDINNLISINSKFPVGSYDLNNINSPIVLDKAENG